MSFPSFEQLFKWQGGALLRNQCKYERVEDARIQFEWNGKKVKTYIIFVFKTMIYWIFSRIAFLFLVVAHSILPWNLHLYGVNVCVFSHC